MIYIDKLINSGLGVNTYMLFSGNSCIIIDPGRDSLELVRKIRSMHLNPMMILLTHGHFDHIEGIEILKREFNIPFFIHKNDEELYYNPLNGGDFSFRKPPIDGFLREGDEIKLNDNKIDVIHTPGHTKGSVSFFFYPYLVTGDTLFYGTIGRTDLPGGSFEELVHSIKEKILILPEEVVILPGHGDETTVGFEKEENPYLQ